MSETKIFRKKDLDLEPVNGMKTIGLVNVSFSDKLGAGIGVFEDCSIPWHITYDEVINILEGQFTLQVGDKIFEAGPGDVLWVPRNTDIVYIAQERVTFFYSVLPAGNAPSTSKRIDFSSVWGRLINDRVPLPVLLQTRQFHLTLLALLPFVLHWQVWELCSQLLHTF